MPETVTVFLETRAPFAGDALLAFLAERAIEGVEATRDGYSRTLRLPGGPALLRVQAEDHGVSCSLALDDPGDATEAVATCRRLLDLDADPAAIAAVLAGDALLAPLLARRPGLRAPGSVDPHEIVVRAMLGQQISVRGARTLAGRLVARLGEPWRDGWRLFPAASAIAGSDPSLLGLPRVRAAALVGACAALADGRVDLRRGSDPIAARAALLALPGIGPWTAEYVAMRALGDPDAFPVTDLGVRHALARLDGGGRADPERWRPYRSYATHHLWASLGVS